MKSNLFFFFFFEVTLELDLLSLALWDALEHRMHALDEVCV